jgi:hypothetical protein
MISNAGMSRWRTYISVIIVVAIAGVVAFNYLYRRAFSIGEFQYPHAVSNQTNVLEAARFAIKKAGLDVNNWTISSVEHWQPSDFQTCLHSPNCSVRIPTRHTNGTTLYFRVKSRPNGNSTSLVLYRAE